MAILGSGIKYKSFYIPLGTPPVGYTRMQTDRHTQRSDCSTWTTKWLAKILTSYERDKLTLLRSWFHVKIKLF